MENNTFSYNYSAARNKEVENIRNKYIPREESKLERLKKLDLRVQMAGTIESLCLGIVGALVFGIGMCFFLDVFAGAVWLTAILMICGTLLMIPAYPIYRRTARKIKAELTPEILRLSEEIINPQKIND
jgi:F0F1-type ATP synthase assembly protein I